MTVDRSARLAAVVIVTLGTGVAAGFFDRFGVVQTAQAQSEEEKRKKQLEKQKSPPPKVQPPPQKAPPPPPPKAQIEKSPVPPVKKSVSPQLQQPPPTARQLPPAHKPGGPDARDSKKDSLKREPSSEKTPQLSVTPPLPQAAPAPVVKKPPGTEGPAVVTPKSLPGPAASQGPAPKRFDEVQKGRLERVEDGGRKKIIQEPGNRTIVKQGNRTIIRHDDAERFRRRPDAKTERRPDGSVETYHIRRDGARIVTVVDADGRLLRRYRRSPDGRERNLVDNRRFYRNLAVGAGVGVGIAIITLNLPPPRITIPREQYVVEYERASDDDLEEALTASPLERLERAYALEEIRDNYELRARMRRIDLDTITFDFGQWDVPADQYFKLERLARILLRVLNRNPDEVFFIEGHTDAVGTDIDNLSLSDRRASAVAQILSEQFRVPEENLVTQGYGEQYLKINALGPEPLNRRVTVLAIGQLMAEQ